MSGFNISSLFGGSGSSGGFIDFGQYAALKNGSYRRLMKAYYADQKKSVSSSKTSTTNKKTASSETTKQASATKNAGLARIKRVSDGLKTAVSDLQKEELWQPKEGDYDREKIAGAVKNFVKEYNDMIAQNANVSASDVQQQVGYLSDLTNTMAQSLEKVGITVGTDGKLAVNEDALGKADVKELTELFQGKNSYGSQVASQADAVARAAVMSASLYSDDGKTFTSLDSIFSKRV